MGRQKGWIWLSLAVVCAIGAGAISFFVLGREVTAAQERATAGLLATPVPVPMVQLPVARDNLVAGQPIDEASYVLKDFPVELAPTNAISTTDTLDGQTLLYNVAAGDIFRPEALVGGAGTPVSGQIDAGKTLLALPIVDLMGETGLVQNGDHVDLLLTLKLADPAGLSENLTGYTIENVTVFRVLIPPQAEDQPTLKPTGLVLSLRPEDAVIVKATKDAGGIIDIVLRSPRDTEPFNAPEIRTPALEALMTGAEKRLNASR